MESLDRLLNVEDLANYLHVPVATLYQWRHRGGRPGGFRVGRHLAIDGPMARTGSKVGFEMQSGEQMSVSLCTFGRS
jgi:hypothetical protein